MAKVAKKAKAPKVVVHGMDLPKTMFAAWSCAKKDERFIEAYTSLQDAADSNGEEFCVGEYQLVRRGVMKAAAPTYTEIND